MKSVVLFVIISILCIFAAASTPPAFDGEWQKVIEKNGVTVYRKEIPNSPVFVFKGEGVINAPLIRVASVLLDFSRSKEWVENVEESRLDHWINNHEYIEYDHVGTPFIV